MGRGSEDMHGCGLQENPQCLSLVGTYVLRWGALGLEGSATWQKDLRCVGHLAHGLPTPFFFFFLANLGLSHNLH